ncbi:MAG TPA: dienelactone hydrolase family protein [Allosphingosinicella sp.]|jgi:carboxymethylenebutenolidase
MSGDEIERAAIDLYDRYAHHGMDRRLFMTELTRLCGGAAAATMMLSGIACSASEPQVAAEDNRIATENAEVQAAPGRAYRVYRARPAGSTWRNPAVIVIHENRGLTDHIRDVTRRLAVAGFAAEAPDMLSVAGGTPVDEDRARQMIGALDMVQTVADGVALIRDFATRSMNHRKVGIVGFCWGGAMVNRLAVAAGAELSAGVAYYGPAPDPAEAARVEAAMLLHYAGNDARVNATGEPWAAALRAAGKDVTAITYPGVDHAFNNDTSAARYNREAAERAWTTTLEFFRRHLGEPAPG